MDDDEDAELAAELGKPNKKKRRVAKKSKVAADAPLQEVLTLQVCHQNLNRLLTLDSSDSACCSCLLP